MSPRPRPLGAVTEVERNAPILTYFPNHPTIQSMNAGCTQNELSLLQNLVNDRKAESNPDPPLGPTGHEIYALEPVFYHAIREGRGKLVKYFFELGIRPCKEMIREACESQSDGSVFQAFLDEGWDINDRESGTAMFGLTETQLWLVYKSCFERTK